MTGTPGQIGFDLDAPARAARMAAGPGRGARARTEWAAALDNWYDTGLSYRDWLASLPAAVEHRHRPAWLPLGPRRRRDVPWQTVEAIVLGAAVHESVSASRHRHKPCPA